MVEEIDYETNKCKDIPCSWIRRVDVKMTRLPKAICRFDVIPIKIAMAFSTKLEQIILKFLWKHKRFQIAKTILTKKNRAERIMLPDFHTYTHIMDTTQL